MEIFKIRPLLKDALIDDPDTFHQRRECLCRIFSKHFMFTEVSTQMQDVRVWEHVSFPIPVCESDVKLSIDSDCFR